MRRDFFGLLQIRKTRRKIEGSRLVRVHKVNRTYSMDFETSERLREKVGYGNESRYIEDCPNRR